MNAPLRLGLFGAGGRMGQAIQAEIAKEPLQGAAWQLGALLKRGDNFPKAAVDVWVDVSQPEASPWLLGHVAHTQTPVLIATTGLSEETLQCIEDLSRQVPVLLSANTSLGITLVTSVVEMLAKHLQRDADVAILETHHRFKRDQPSGTALALAKRVAAASGQDLTSIDVSSCRVGDLPGEHRVLFSLGQEEIEVKHVVQNRSVFAKGALIGAQWLCQQEKGLYSMHDIIQR